MPTLFPHFHGDVGGWCVQSSGARIGPKRRESRSNYFSNIGGDFLVKGQVIEPSSSRACVVEWSSGRVGGVGEVGVVERSKIARRG
jgi:hypothetical protein